MIFVQTACIHAHTTHTHTNTCQLTAAHMFRRRLMQGGTREKGWTRVNQGLAKMPPSLSLLHKHSPSACNIYDFMHMLKRVPTNYSCMLRITSKGWQQDEDKQKRDKQSEVYIGNDFN